MNNKRPLVLWGCGEIAKEAIERIKGIPVDACVDRHAERKREFGGKKVLKPTDFFDCYAPGKCLVIVCANPCRIGASGFIDRWRVWSGTRSIFSTGGVL